MCVTPNCHQLGFLLSQTVFASALTFPNVGSSVLIKQINKYMPVSLHLLNYSATVQDTKMQFVCLSVAVTLTD